jgi:hemerythrin-like domain-containing protein
MRLSRLLRTEQENITRLIAVLGKASTEVRNNKRAKPAFFIMASDFITEYINEGFFKKEELVIKVLEDGGFSPDNGPIAAIRSDQEKSRAASEILVNAARQWQAGEDGVRLEVGWASNEYTSSVRQHLDRLKALIFPLIEQTISVDEEDKVAEAINNLDLGNKLNDGTDKYIKMLKELEDEYSDWK